MLKAYPLSTSFRDQFIIALLTGVWLYLFLALVGPFDAAELTLMIRIQLMLGYGLVFVATYLLCILIQHWLHRSSKQWNGLLEAIILLCFSVLCLPLCYAYYTTDWVRGDYGFSRFLFEIYLPTLVILLPALALARRYAARRQIEQMATTLSATADTANWVQLSGNNKLDVLRLRADRLIALSAANNYVTVYYLEEGALRKKLLRNSLKKMQENLPMLLQVHRSHLINPNHFIEWKDATTLALTQLEIPVAQSYKSVLLDELKFRP